MKFSAARESMAQALRGAAQVAGAQFLVCGPGQIVEWVQLIEMGREQVSAQPPALAVRTGEGDGMAGLRQNRNATLSQVWRDTRQKIGAVAKVEALAKELGYDVADLFDLPRKAKRVSEAKYRHPENPSLTWSGRGRKPQWFNDWLGAGKSADDLKIA